MMKKWTALILCLCMMLCTAANAEGENSFLIKVWDQSGLEISYLRFEFYLGETCCGYTCSSPDEGEAFYRCGYTPEKPEELKELTIRGYYGISELAPEDAILQVMMGNLAEEHPVEMPEMELKPGMTYETVLTVTEEGAVISLKPAE